MSVIRLTLKRANLHRDHFPGKRSAMKAQFDARRTADFLAGQSGFEDLQAGDKRRITGMKRIRVPDIFHEGVHLLRREAEG